MIIHECIQYFSFGSANNKHIIGLLEVEKTSLEKRIKKIEEGGDDLDIDIDIEERWYSYMENKSKNSSLISLLSLKIQEDMIKAYKERVELRERILEESIEEEELIVYSTQL